ncbi:HD domain-containing phosphohydrolase [Desertibaculum subflavum]|uniref:HD domain-containing phosphohydrolase n=1 Tax=Desertibaculum subflavum TaxID=2268458 RepID=UPI0034D31176
MDEASPDLDPAAAETGHAGGAAVREILEIGIALAAERDRARLAERILFGAMAIARADGGTIYLRTAEDQLEFSVRRTISLGIHQGGTSGEPIDLPPIPLVLPDGSLNCTTVATCTANTARSLVVDDAYAETGFNFAGPRAFDARTGYRSVSFLGVPLVDHTRHVIGVIQLINARDVAGRILPFDLTVVPLVEALSGFAGVAVENQQLIDGQKRLFDNLVQVMARAIDAKSPYTGTHCQRVPVLTQMLARAACDTTEGPYAHYGLTPAEWYELEVAGGLHDIGKVVTPVHVMDKSTKLETIYDRIGEIRTRFEVLRREADIAYYRAVAAGSDVEEAARMRAAELAAIDADLAFLEASNVGGESLAEVDLARLETIAARPYADAEGARPLLSPEELANLSVRRGTLTSAERQIINDHMVHTVDMLEALPWPKHLARVPHIAGTHHEHMDGTGYPRGLRKHEISPLGRMMAIADIFEALTAQDRPYKPPKPISESLAIMARMSRDHHIDHELFELFLTSGVWRDYARQFLLPEQLDAIDVEALLKAAQPRAG